MEIYLNEKYAEKVMEISNGFGVESKIIGRVEASQENKLTISSVNGTFLYN